MTGVHHVVLAVREAELQIGAVGTGLIVVAGALLHHLRRKRRGSLNLVVSAMN
jgi:hypothetical protein